MPGRPTKITEERELPPPPLSSYYSCTRMCPHNCCKSKRSLLTASPTSGLFLSMRSTQETTFVFFFSALHPNNDLFIWDRGSMHDTSFVTTGGESSWDRDRESAHILWSLLTIFDCAIVLHGELNAYLGGEEKRRRLLLCLSGVMFCGGEGHYWQWHKQLFSS